MKSLRRALSLNERRLVELVFRHERIARIDLAAAADVTPASVTRLVAGLMEVGLFSEKASKDGARGQPKKLLGIKRQQFCSLGFYLFTDKIQAALVDFDGTVIAQDSKPMGTSSARNVVESMNALTEELLSEVRNTNRTFLGVGLGIPGNFGSFGKFVEAHEAFLGLDGFAIQEALLNYGDWPVFLENDGTAAALGEYLFGGHDADTLFMMHIGYGFGGGAVLNGRPYRGYNGNACLPGALFPYNQPRPTLQDLEKHLQDLGIEPSTTLFANRGSKSLSPELTVWKDRAKEQIKLAVRLVTGLFDPAVIVIGGALPSFICDIIAAEIDCEGVEGPSRGLVAAPLYSSNLGDLCGPIGAASIPFFRGFFPGSTPLAEQSKRNASEFKGLDIY